MFPLWMLAKNLCLPLDFIFSIGDYAFFWNCLLASKTTNSCHFLCVWSRPLPACFYLTSLVLASLLPLYTIFQGFLSSFFFHSSSFIHFLLFFFSSAPPHPASLDEPSACEALGPALWGLLGQGSCELFPSPLPHFIPGLSSAVRCGAVRCVLSVTLAL